MLHENMGFICLFDPWDWNTILGCLNRLVEGKKIGHIQIPWDNLCFPADCPKKTNPRRASFEKQSTFRTGRRASVPACQAAFHLTSHPALDEALALDLHGGMRLLPPLLGGMLEG